MFRDAIVDYWPYAEGHKWGVEIYEEGDDPIDIVFFKTEEEANEYSEGMKS